MPIALSVDMSGNRGNRLRFSREEDEDLIAAVAKNPLLYNYENKSYHDHPIRDAVWEIIARDIGKSVPECKIRWKSLKDVYRKRRREMDNSANKKPCKWEHLEALSFLEGIVCTKGSPEKTYLKTDETDMKIEILDEKLESDTHSEVLVKEELADQDLLAVKTERFEEEVQPIQLFFDSMARTVMTFPLPLAVKVKMEVLRAVSNAELELWNGQSRT